MTTHALEVLGVFPSWDSVPGGVQSSGREAWRGIVDRVGEERSELLRYESGTSKARAVLQALRVRRDARVLLVWHLHLLKLMPFVHDSRSRVVLFLHGIEAWMKQDRLAQLLLRRVDLVLSNSDHTWDRFLQWNPQCRAFAHRTVHLGLGSTSGGPLPAPAGRPAALMIGRLDAGEDYKGHRAMIDAWPSVVARVPGSQLWIVGDGALRPELESAARRQSLPADAIRFFGQVSDAEKEQLIADCRCLALPSRGEGFGLVYLEAMRMGRPCLVSTVDAGREVVNPPESGLAVEPDNTSGTAEAVQRLLTPGRQWDAWSTAARARYDAHFTGDRFRGRLLQAIFGS